MIEEQLRAELAAHMAGATPVTDWAAPAIRHTARRHRRQLAGTVAAAVALAAIVVGAVTPPRHGGRAQLEPAAHPSPAAPNASPNDYPVAIAAPDGAWSIGFRETANPDAAVCLDVMRAGVKQPIDACAPDNPNDVSFHQVEFIRESRPATLEFGLVPAGTRSVTLVSGSGTVATLTPQPIRGAQPLVWFEEATQEPTAVNALLANGTTLDLLSAQMKTCPGARTESPQIASCEAPTPPTTAPVQSGYGHDETFCSAQGELHYVVIKGSVTLTSTLTGLPKERQLGIDWINNSVRGYNVAAERTTATGTFDAATLTMFRPGEVRGIAMQVTDGNVVILRLNAC